MPLSPRQKSPNLVRISSVCLNWVKRFDEMQYAAAAALLVLQLDRSQKPVSLWWSHDVVVHPRYQTRALVGIWFNRSGLGNI